MPSFDSQQVLADFANMDHSTHMDDSSTMTMGMGGSSCKISMLWNWYTIDACFLSRSWHITSGGGMVASCIGVLLLTVCLEALRRLGKEYDAFLTRGFNAQAAAANRQQTKTTTTTTSGDGARPNGDDVVVVTDVDEFGSSVVAGPQTMVFRASLLQQLGRAVIHATTFGVAYIVMLLAMYFNGYIIISIFVGAGVGKFLCDWLVCRVVVGNGCARPMGQDTNEHAIDEPTICCG